MSNIEQLPLKQTSPVERITISVELLADLLTEAEDGGYRRALWDASLDALQQSELRNKHTAISPTRQHLWAARIRATLLERAKA
jgi:hypothetical protein